MSVHELCCVSHWHSMDHCLTRAASGTSAVVCFDLTLTVQDEFMRGVTICDDFLSRSGKVGWARLFEEDSFFQQFKNYLQIEVVAADEQQFRAWEGWVHSRYVHEICYAFVQGAHVYLRRVKSPSASDWRFLLL